MAQRKTTRKTKSSALGDDSLSWLDGDEKAKENVVKKATRKKIAKKKTIRKKAKVKTNQNEKIQKDKIQAGESITKGVQTDRQDQNPAQNEDIDKHKGDEASLVLDPIITINDAQTMYTQLKLLLESKQDITIEAYAVEMLDTAILQLLFAFVNKIKAENREVVWTNPSEEMISRATILNLQAGLGLDGAD